MCTGISQPPVSPLSRTPRSVWIALILIAAALIGGGAGLLAWAGGANVPMAILTGGGAFGGAIVLLLTLCRYGAGDDR